jgi:hypothetical protein
MSTSSGAVGEKAPRPLGLPKVLQELREETDELLSQIVNLRDRLIPVLLPTEPSAVKGKEESLPSSQAPLVEELQDILYRVLQVRTLLSLTLDRLEL